MGATKRLFNPNLENGGKAIKWLLHHEIGRKAIKGLLHLEIGRKAIKGLLHLETGIAGMPVKGASLL